MQKQMLYNCELVKRLQSVHDDRAGQTPDSALSLSRNEIKSRLSERNQQTH